MPYAYKIRDSFATSPLSGKRDYAVLPSETDGFYRIDERNGLEPISFKKEEKVKKKILK